VDQSSLTRDAVARFYDAEAEHEWARMDRHRTEFAVTLRALAEHLPPAPARVLDCGGGPGRYAIELARQGYAVTLFDLAAGNLRLACEKANEAGVTLAGYKQGTATDLGRFADDSFDAVLLLGPLYHLLEEAERAQALAEAGRVLQPGGPLFAAFISRYAGHRDAARREPTWLVTEPAQAETLLTSGRLVGGLEGGEGGPGFVAYMAHPTEVAPLFWRAGFEVLAVLGVEGLVSIIEDGGVNTLIGAAWDAWLDVNHRAAADPSIHGCVEHLLVVARKPRWRAVLRRIARQLDAAGVHYRVVGGAVPALHRVPLVVNDIDIETDAAGAYAFQAQFPDHVRQPVAFCTGDAYRSHFGRFDFVGVTVEVMGDLHRREGTGWMPTAAKTEALVNLDGVPVRVATLEEETLAYIRRGRLARAAECLPHCDHARLLALLRGERATDVL